MTKKEYREAYRLSEREKAQVWNEIRETTTQPRRRRPSSRRPVLPRSPTPRPSS